MGSAGRPVLSGDGRYAAFSSCATDLPGEDGQATDIYRLDLVNGEIVRAHGTGDHGSYLPTLSIGGWVGSHEPARPPLVRVSRKRPARGSRSIGPVADSRRTHPRRQSS